MTSLNILFWNINKKDVINLIAFYCEKFNVDVLVLLEDYNSGADVLRALNRRSVKYHVCKSNSRKISIFTSFDSSYFDLKDTDSEFVSLVEFTFPNKSILLGGVHLSSKQTAKTSRHQSFIARNTKLEIEKVEEDVKHANTILVGDFNMNPFEDGMVEPEAFNAAMAKSIALKITRSVNGLGTGSSLKYNYFYNPMWSFMGDLSKHSPGTYYYYGDEHDNHYRWNMLDQILIRPGLISNFVEASLVIINTDNKGNALIDDSTRSRRQSQNIDHLPVFFTINI